jgi:hypothetical protein
MSPKTNKIRHNDISQRDELKDEENLSSKELYNRTTGDGNRMEFPGVPQIDTTPAGVALTIASAILIATILCVGIALLLAHLGY